jgi:RHS repeat-associated protein
VTRIQRTDVANAPYVQIDHVTEGNDGEGKPSSIQVRDAGNNVLGETAYSYYPSGEIKTATNGDRQLYYEYSADPVKITVTERLTDSETVIYGKTEYWYGKVGELGLEDPPGEGRDENRPGQYATWVTRIDPANPANNQRTRYLYNHVTQGSEEIRTYLHSMTDPLGTTTTYTYDQYKPGRVTQVDVTNGETFVSRTAYQYDLTFGAVTSVTRLDASNQSLGEETYDYYPGTLWLRTHKDVRGDFTHYDRVQNKPWQVSAVKMAPGPYEPYDWDDPYDTTIQILKQYEYYGDSDPNGKPGQLKKEIVPLAYGVNDQVTEYRYSRNGVFYSSPTETIYKDASGTPRTSATYYDEFGRVEKTVDASGRAVWYRYDDLGRPTLTVYKWVSGVVDGTPEVYTENHYNCCSLEWSRDENGNKTYYAYDDAKRVTKVWTDTQNPNGEAHPLVEYTYDAFGNKKTVTTRSDANTTRVTTYTYDKLNRVTKIEYPGGIVGDEEFGYDVARNLWWKKDGNGDVTLYRYDGHNRLWKVYYNYTGSLNPPSYEGLTPDVTYGYQQISDPYWPEMVESHGNLKTSMTDASGTSRYYYDIQGRLIRYVPPTKDQEEYVIAYTYNNLGEKTSVRIGPPEPEDGNNFYYWYFGVPYVLPLDEQNIVYEASYEYFANGWLKRVKSGANTIAEYSYDAVGNRIQQTNGNGTSTEYAFDSDPRYRVTSITHKRGSNVLAQIGYPSRDSVGNPLGMTDWTGTWGYDYDSNNRLIGATPPNPVPGQPAGGPYGYDWVGNRIHPPGDPNQTVYNDGDQLVRWPGMYRYSYDDAGNLVQVRNDSQTQVLKSYTYSPAGLLATATFRDKDGNTRTLSNTWDADSNRVSFDANGTEYELVYDTTAGVPAVIEESTSGSTAYCVREPGGSLIARLNATDGIRYYHFDELGSTRLLTDGSGNVTDRYAYDAYGSVLAHDQYSGSVDQPYQYVGQLGYYAHHMEPDFGLLQLGVRFYDPEVGRFTQRDPLEDELSRYAYASESPTARKDPSGLFDPDDPFDRNLALTYLCQARCVLTEFLGLPLEENWQEVVLEKLTERELQSLSKRLASCSRRGAREMARAVRCWLRDHASEGTLRRLGLYNFDTNLMRMGLKALGKCLLFYDLLKTASCMWKCNTRYW